MRYTLLKAKKCIALYRVRTPPPSCGFICTSHVRTTATNRCLVVCVNARNVSNTHLVVGCWTEMYFQAKTTHFATFFRYIKLFSFLLFFSTIYNTAEKQLLFNVFGKLIGFYVLSHFTQLFLSLQFLYLLWQWHCVNLYFSFSLAEYNNGAHLYTNNNCKEKRLSRCEHIDTHARTHAILLLSSLQKQYGHSLQRLCRRGSSQGPRRRFGHKTEPCLCSEALREANKQLV